MSFMFPPMFVAPAYFHGEGYSNAPNASMSEKSAAALRRESEAIELFDVLRSQGIPTNKMRRLLLEPSCHLTGACWSTFSKYVRSFPGWMAKRRVATLDEKEASKEKRKCKVYFVEVIYDPAKVARNLANQANEEAHKRTVASLFTESSQAVPEEASEECKRTTTDTTPMQPVAKRVKILQDSSNMQHQDATVSRVTP